MTATANIRYAPHADAAPETEIAALSHVYKFVIDCRARKEATRPGGADDTILRHAKGVSHVDQRPG